MKEKLLTEGTARLNYLNCMLYRLCIGITPTIIVKIFYAHEKIQV
jgi:hypothetical protein